MDAAVLLYFVFVFLRITNGYFMFSGEIKNMFPNLRQQQHYNEAIALYFISYERW